MRKSLSFSFLTLVTAASGLSIATPAAADCSGGFVCGMMGGLLGTGAIDQAIADYRSRDFDASVGNQILGGVGSISNNPIGRPATAPLPNVRYPAPPGGTPVAPPIPIPNQ